MVSRGDMLRGAPRLAAEGREVMSATGWLSQMPEPFREALLSSAIWRLATPGQEFVRAGDPEGGLFGIVRGTAEMSLPLGHPDARLLHLGGPGFWGGYGPLIGHPRAVSLTARGDVLWALIPRHMLLRILGEQPGWWLHIAQLADLNLQLAMEIVADLTRQDSRLRAIAVLLRLAGCRFAGGEPAEVRISQVDVAAVSVMSRNTFNGIIGDLARDGLAEVGYRAILLPNPERLRRMLMEE